MKWKQLKKYYMNRLMIEYQSSIYLFLFRYKRNYFSEEFKVCNKLWAPAICGQ